MSSKDGRSTPAAPQNLFAAMGSEPEVEAYRAVIAGYFPELANAGFTLATRGWDCVAVDVADRLIFKFPRHQAGERSLAKEASLLGVIRGAVSIPVPDMTLETGPPLFSWHVKLKGEHLLPPQYERLPEPSRQHLAAAMALFFAELHRLDGHIMTAAGAGPIKPWLAPDEILLRLAPIVSSELRDYAGRTIASWRALPPDPHGTTYGFFDGHGWNMAFDHAAERLNGIYDFGDSGFGSLHQEFIYPNLVAPDLTARIVGAYEALTGRSLDRQRIDLLSSVHRLSELAEMADDPDNAAMARANVERWQAR